MKKQPLVICLIFASLLASGLLASMQSEAAHASRRTENTPSPANTFSPWTRWSATVSEAQFELDRCLNPTLGAAQPVLAGDLNGDGRSDLICSYQHANGNAETFVKLAEQSGYSPWQAWDSFMSRTDRCEMLQIGRFDDDHLDDLVCLWDNINDDGSTVYVKLSTGEAFSPWYKLGTVADDFFDWTACQTLLLADNNNDGTEDIICPYRYLDGEMATWTMRLNGATQTSWEQSSPKSALGSGCQAFRMGDVDGDGEADLVCYAISPGLAFTSHTQVQLASNGALGEWQLWSPTADFTTFDLNNCQTLQLGDVDGDGLADWICTYLYPNGDSAVLVQSDTPSTPNQQFRGWINWSDTSSTSFELARCLTPDTGRLEMVDVNGDKRSDIVCVYQQLDGSTETFVQLSSGVDFSGWRSWSQAAAAQNFDITECAALQLGDVDADQHTDLICSYLYLDGSSATFGQRVNLFRVMLPLVIQ